MLAQDVANSILPIGGSSEKRPFKVTLASQDDKVSEMVVRGLSNDEGSWSRDLARATSHFFSECALRLMSFGETVYEITFLSDETSGTELGFKFVGVQHATFTWRKGALVQSVPKEYADLQKVPREIVVQPDLLLRFELPERFRADYPKLLAGLAALGGKLFPDFAFPMAQERNAIPFDSTDYIRTLNMAIAQVVGAIGWDARGTWGEHTLEYFALYRRLRFESFKVLLRDQILSTVNRGISAAGKRLSFSATLELHGVPTLEEIDRATERLESSDCTFREILSSFKWY